MRDVVLVNLGNGADCTADFVEVDVPVYAQTHVSVKSSVADLNADGRLDVFVMTLDRPLVLRNTTVGGVLSFVDWTPASAFPSGGVHAGAATVVFDSDGDGDLDVFLGAGTDDFLFERVPSQELDESQLAGGLLPPFLDAEPSTRSASAATSVPRDPERSTSPSRTPPRPPAATAWRLRTRSAEAR